MMKQAIGPVNAPAAGERADRTSRMSKYENLRCPLNLCTDRVHRIFLRSATMRPKGGVDALTLSLHLYPPPRCAFSARVGDPSAPTRQRQAVDALARRREHGRRAFTKAYTRPTGPATPAAKDDAIAVGDPSARFAIAKRNRMLAALGELD